MVGWARATWSTSAVELMQIELFELGARSRARGTGRVGVSSTGIVENREDVVGIY